MSRRHSTETFPHEPTRVVEEYQSAHENVIAAVAAGAEVPPERRAEYAEHLRSDLRFLDAVRSSSPAIQAKVVAHILGHDVVPPHLAPALREYARDQLQRDLQRIEGGVAARDVDVPAASARGGEDDAGTGREYPEPERIPSDLSREELERRREFLSAMRQSGSRARAKQLDEVIDGHVPEDIAELDRTYVETEASIARRLRALDGDPLERERDRVLATYLSPVECEAFERGEGETALDRACELDRWLREVDIAQAARDPKYFQRWFGQEYGAQYKDVAVGRRRFALVVVYEKSRLIERIETAMHALGIDRDPLGALSLRAPDRPQDAGQPIDTVLAHALVAGWLAAASHRNIEERMAAEDRILADVHALLGAEPELSVSDADIVEVRDGSREDDADTTIDRIADLRRSRDVSERRGESTAHVDGELRIAINELEEASAHSRTIPDGQGSDAGEPIRTSPALARDLVRIGSFDQGGWSDTFITPVPRVSWRGETSHAALGASASVPRVPERIAVAARRAASAAERPPAAAVETAESPPFIERLQAHGADLLRVFGYAEVSGREAEIIERQFDRLRREARISPESTTARIAEIVLSASHRLAVQLGDRATEDHLAAFRGRLTRQLHALHWKREDAHRLRLGSLIRTAFDPRWQRRGFFGVLNRLLS